jgi:hypothetical protein
MPALIRLTARFEIRACRGVQCVGRLNVDETDARYTEAYEPVAVIEETGSISARPKSGDLIKRY